MFGFIKKFFSGIIAFFSGLLGDKKSQDEQPSAPKMKKSKGYFLELDETGNLKPTTEAKTEAKKPEPAKVEAAQPETKQPEPAKAAVATVERPKAQPAQAKKPEASKVEVPSKNGKVEIEAQANPPAATNNGKVDSQTEQTFAPKYLAPEASRGRRRPGPSMDMFRDMARQVKTPS